MRDKGLDSERTKIRLRHHRHHRHRTTTTARRRSRTTRPPFRTENGSTCGRINVPSNTHRRTRERGRTHNTYSTTSKTHNLHSKTTFISPTTQIRIICRSPHPPRPIRHHATSRTAPVIRQFSGATLTKIVKIGLNQNRAIISVHIKLKIWIFSRRDRERR